MTKLLRKVTSWLASPRLAVVLLLVVGVWSFLGTLVPQGASGDAKVVAWGLANPVLASFVSALGFHQTFSSPLFVATVLLLAASTGVCSWRRTRVALRRYRLLREITDEEASRLLSRPSFTVGIGPSAPVDPLEAATDALGGMGLRVRERDGYVVAVSRPWAVLGSPVFHWALLLLILVILGGRLYRMEGLMGVPVGDSRPLAAESFGLVDSGALYKFSVPPDRVRVDKMNLVYMVDGLDRGPAPTVSILKPDGSVAASGVVYPNKPLRYGSIIVHPSEIGLSPGFALVTKDGVQGDRTNMIVDFSETTPGRTTAAEFELTAEQAADSIVASVTVPLQTKDGEFIRAVPKQPSATFVVRPATGGSPIASETVLVGQDIQLPNGSRLRLLGVGYYARLSIVDDPSIPLVYALLIVGMVAVSVSILGRQSLALLALQTDEAGEARLEVWFRDWRVNKLRLIQAEEAVREALSVRSDTNGEPE
ncbi:MAG: cytochrome c biogenesis protein ResB [Actinomycetes bacterium]